MTVWAAGTTLVAQHDCLLLDLDGTLFRGAEPTVGAREALAETDAAVFYVTNNASRSAADVAEHLQALGFSAQPDDVVTSAQAAARLLGSQLAPGSRVLVVGTEALAAEVSAEGLRPVRLAADRPVAVVQGHSPHTAWADLAEAALALRDGAVWVAANVDLTLPTERGLLPGNGAMVTALRAATGREPQIAGKPEPTLMTETLARGTYRAPLVVGDRLDTDIAAANAAGLPSLLVLTGVSTARDAVLASPAERPTYIAHDLRGLSAPAERLRVGSQPGWRVDSDSGSVTVTAGLSGAEDDGLAVVRALASEAWRVAARHGGSSVAVVAGDDAATHAMRRWSLLDPPIG